MFVESLVGEGDSNSGAASRWSASNGHLLWFRVAVIVVPSIGAVLLAVIVYAAVRMLRNDGLLRHNRKTSRLRHRSVPPANGCGAEGPLLTKAYCIVLSAVGPGRQSQWRPQRVCPEGFDDNKSGVCGAGLRSFEAPKDSSHVDTRESCRVYCELHLDECHCYCHVCACEYNKVVVEHEKNSGGKDYGQTREHVRTSLRSADRDKTRDALRSERTARQGELLENRELQQTSTELL